MTIAVGAPLDEVFGQGYTKKKSKKKKEQENSNHVSRQEMQKMVHNFDENFQQNSAIMPFGTVLTDNYENLKEEDKTHQGRYFPIDQYTLNGQKLPEKEVVQQKEQVESPPQQPLSSPTSAFSSAPNAVAIEGNPSPISSPQAIAQQPEKGTASSEEVKPTEQGPGVYITNEEYKELLKLKNEKQTEFINNQMQKSQLIESFSNINDDFNDVLLFGLMGIFFLLIIDYVYKLGKKAY